ncbi:NlpC/P60 family protein [Gulosibacter bifidus]|uniref:NlpC/P60 family protein n=1 Tax=Gulosibacter bifidus TaxID=272239 RepID=A0ABW5RI95_9MICO|nr:NlpC/P60 family protein [Gulosibacter bifidus]
MDNITQITEAPLTRRQAREIERRTGVRPVAKRDASAFVKDTGKIERNDMEALISAVPTEVLAKVAAPIVNEAPLVTDEAQADAEVRSLTIRAAVPASLVAKRRRRAAGSFAAAASVTALAAAGFSSMATADVDVAAGEHQANLVSAANGKQDAVKNPVAVKAPVVDAKAIKAESDQAAAVESFDAASVAMAVEQEAPAPAASVATESYDEGSSDDNGAAAAPVSVAAVGGIQDAIVAGAMAQLGISGLDCTDMVQNALASAGLTTSRFDGGYDMGVESFYQFGSVIPASEAQPGDIMIAPGQHVAIYIGNGQAVHGGWNGGADDTVIDGVNTYAYDYVRVNG